jgi:hypothetical protein
MKYKGDITSPEVMVHYQGDRVLVHRTTLASDIVLTLVRVMTTDKQQMRLCNREDKTHKPDWVMTQAMWEATLPAKPNKEGCKWELSVV